MNYIFYSKKQATRSRYGTNEIDIDEQWHEYTEIAHQNHSNFEDAILIAAIPYNKTHRIRCNSVISTYTSKRPDYRLSGLILRW